MTKSMRVARNQTTGLWPNGPQDWDARMASRVRIDRFVGGQCEITCATEDVVTRGDIRSIGLRPIAIVFSLVNAKMSGAHSGWNYSPARAMEEVFILTGSKWDRNADTDALSITVRLLHGMEKTIVLTLPR